MVLVIWVGDRLHEFDVTTGAANVLGRSAALAGDTGRIDRSLRLPDWVRRNVRRSA